jgi:uncharacterized RDD family membrane protein YckC
MTEPPQGNYPPPPPGGYPPPPPSGYPLPPPHGVPGYPPPPPPGPVLPKEAYTPWITRVLAWIIDYIPALVIGGIGYGVMFGTADSVCAESDYGVYCSMTPTGLGLTVAIIAWLLTLAYLIWNYGYRQGTTGSSIGKSVLKFQVVSEKTWQPIGFGLSIVRQVVHFVDGICYIGYLWPLWDPKRQTFADKIMSTVCVPLNPQPLPPGPGWDGSSEGADTR